MNWIIFIIIFVSLLRKRHNINTVDKKDMKTRLRQQFIVALTLSLLFGLGWGMGFATTSSITSVPLSATLQAIFILLTGFQGLLIFIMHCVRCEEARDVWKEWLYIITCHKVEVGKLTSQSTAIFRLNNSGTHKPKAPPNGKQPSRMLWKRNGKRSWRTVNNVLTNQHLRVQFLKQSQMPKRRARHPMKMQ